MVDCAAARGRNIGHTIQVVSPLAGATGAADHGVINLVQEGHTWWVLEPKGEWRAAVVYATVQLKRGEHPLMRCVGEVDVVRVETDEEVCVGAILRALETQVGRIARDGAAEDIKEQIGKAPEWVSCGNKGDQRRWIVPPGVEDEKRKKALAMARRMVEEAKQKVLEAEEAPKERDRADGEDWAEVGAG